MRAQLPGASFPLVFQNPLVSPFLCQLEYAPTDSALQLKFEEHHQHVVWRGISFNVYEVFRQLKTVASKTTLYTIACATCPSLGQTKILRKESGFKMSR
jgi:hypothetical protein